MRALIVGLGYLGECAAKRLKEEGFTVDAAVRTPKESPTISTFFTKETLKRVDTDLLLVAVAPKRGESYELYVETAKWLLPLLQPHTHLFYTSSTSLYGDHKGGEVNEESPLLFRTREGELLAETEKLFLTHPKVTLLRLGEIIGPGRSPVHRLRSGTPLPGTGENPVNLTPVSLATQALVSLYKTGKTGIFNVTLPDHPTRRSWYETLAKDAGLPPPIWSGEGSSKHADPKRVSSQKLLRLFPGLFAPLENPF